MASASSQDRAPRESGPAPGNEASRALTYEALRENTKLMREIEFLIFGMHDTTEEKIQEAWERCSLSLNRIFELVHEVREVAGESE